MDRWQSCCCEEERGRRVVKSGEEWWKRVVWRNRGVLHGCGCQVLAVLPSSRTRALLCLGSVFSRVGSLPVVAAGASFCLRAMAAFRSRSILLLGCEGALPACSRPLLLLISSPAETAWRADRNFCRTAWLTAVCLASAHICHHLVVAGIADWRQVFSSHPQL